MARTVSFDVLAIAKSVGFDELGNKIKGVADSAQKNISALWTTVAALGPAMIPLTAGVAALAAGFTGLGAAGLVAFLGLKEQWKAGTLQATDLGQQITKMQANFAGLKAVTATAIAPGLTAGLKDINALSSPLQSAFGKLATQFGEIAGHVAPALVAIFLKLMPLFTGIGDQVVRLSAGFQRWAQNGTGVTKFVQYAQQQLPVVEHTLINLVQAIEHVVKALTPLGGGTLSTLKLFSDVLAHIPVGVVQALYPALVGLLIASKVAAAFGLLDTSLKKTTAAEAATTAETGILATTLSTALIPATVTAIGLYYVLGPLLDKVAGNTGTFSDQLNTLRGKTLNAIPGVANFVGLTGRLAALADIASGKVRAVGGAMDGIPRNVNSNINVNAAAAKAQALGLLDILNAIPSEKYVQITTITNKIAAGSAGTNLAGRAAGGPVAAGQSYIVGEHRPEVFTPQQSGYITPYVPSGDIHVHLHGAIIGNARQAIMEIKRGLEEISHNGQPLAVKIAGS